MTLVARGTRFRRPAASAVGAHIIQCAGIAVVTRRSVVGVHAARRRAARVICARVRVIATERRTSGASATRTGVVGRAGIAVVTRRSVVGVHAARRRVTRVICARVPVVATDRTRSHTNPGLTAISCSADTTIVTRCAIRLSRIRAHARPGIAGAGGVTLIRCRAGDVKAQVRRQFALARATCVVDCSNFDLAQRTAEDFHFIHGAVELEVGIPIKCSATNVEGRKTVVEIARLGLGSDHDPICIELNNSQRRIVGQREVRPGV